MISGGRWNIWFSLNHREAVLLIIHRACPSINCLIWSIIGDFEVKAECTVLRHIIIGWQTWHPDPGSWPHSSQGCCQRVITNWTGQRFQSLGIFLKAQRYQLKMFRGKPRLQHGARKWDSGKNVHHQLLVPWHRKPSELEKGVKSKGIWVLNHLHY